MDEGIDSFTEAVMMDRRYRYLYELPFRVGFTDEETQRTFIAAPDFDPIATKAWQFSTDRSYARNSYARPAETIEQIRRLAGERSFWPAFRRYAERWRFDHPTTEDFLDEMRTLGLPDFEMLVRKAFYGTGGVDVHVLRAVSESRDRFTGYDDTGNLVDDDRGKKPRVPDAKDGGGPYQTVVVVGREGDLPLPVDVLLQFENGKTYRTTWDGTTKWVRLKTDYESKLAEVVLDPDGKIVLDRDPFNNVRTVGIVREPSASAKVRAYALHLVEILLSSLWCLP